VGGGALFNSTYSRLVLFSSGLEEREYRN